MTNSQSEFDLALSHIRDLIASLSRLERVIHQLSNSATMEGAKEFPLCDIPITEHRRLHKPGRTPKIDMDPALQSFILARIDRLTFHQIADEIAAHFPPDRQVGKSVVHAWWRRTQAPKR